MSRGTPSDVPFGNVFLAAARGLDDPAGEASMGNQLGGGCSDPGKR